METKYTLMMTMLLTLVVAFGQPRYEEAIRSYKEALQEYRVRNLNAALSLVNESMNTSPTADAAYLSGLIYEALGKEMRAVSSYEAALKLDPGYSEAIFQKGIIYLRHGDPGQAYRDFTSLISGGEPTQTRGLYFELDPMGQQQSQVLSMVNLKSRLFHYRGQASEKLGNYEDALSDYGMALELDTLPDYLVSRALLFSRMKRPEAARSDLRMAIALDPDHQVAWYNLVLLDGDLMPPEELMDSSEFGPTLGLLAARAMEKGDYALARRYLDRSIRNDPQNALSYVNRGRALMKLGLYASAREDFHQAKNIEEDRVEVLYLIGNAYFHEDNFEQALVYYHQYLAVDPTNDMIWYNAAMAYLEQGNHEEACHFLKRAVSLGGEQAAGPLEKYCD